MFGQVRRSQLISPYFPLLIQERFHFDKVCVILKAVQGFDKLLSQIGTL